MYLGEIFNIIPYFIVNFNRSIQKKLRVFITNFDENVDILLLFVVFSNKDHISERSIFDLLFEIPREHKNTKFFIVNIFHLQPINSGQSRSAI